jgi:hypothetical protein
MKRVFSLRAGGVALLRRARAERLQNHHAVGAVKYVAWGKGAFAVPGGVTQMTSVIPAADGNFNWQAAQSVQLTENPILFK